MKKIIIVATTLALSTGSAFAARIFGDGSMENTYVRGASVSQGIHQQTHETAGFDNDGSVEDSYYHGRKLNVPLSTFDTIAPQSKRLNDGSPASNNC